MSRFLVTGGTGRQGGGLVQHLLHAGKTVHALTRNASSDQALRLKALGVLVFEGDIGDVDKVSRAAQGTTGVFLNPPYRGGPESSTEASKRFINAIRNIPGIETLVVSSAIGTGEHPARLAEDPNYPQSDYYGDKADLEAAARQSGLRNIHPSASFAGAQLSPSVQQNTLF